VQTCDIISAAHQKMGLGTEVPFIETEIILKRCLEGIVVSEGIMMPFCIFPKEIKI
jgi:hypothetical protein